MRSAMVAVYAMAGVIATLYAVLSWRRRKVTPLALSLAVIMAACAEWSLAQALAMATSTPWLALLFNYAIYPGVATVVAAFYWHATVFTGTTGRRRRGLLLIHPILLTAVVATDPWHHTFYRLFEMTPDAGIVPHPGPLYWVHTAYSYGLLACGTAIVVRAMRRAVRGQRRVFMLFLASASAPVVGNLVTLFADVHAQRFDLTPVLFLVTGVLWWWAERSGISRERVPVSYARVIAALSDAVMVLDPDGRFVDVNPAARTLLATLNPAFGSAPVGRHWQEVVGPHLTSVLTEVGQTTYAAPHGAVYDIRIERIEYADGDSSGTVVVVRDITELERLRSELTEHAVRDGLTGVFNRRHLTAVLDTAVRAASAQHPVSVVMIDVDHFKAVNDRHGHAVGDRVLRVVAQELAAAAGANDTVARYGGEEFVVVMPGVGAEEAAERAERWRRGCAGGTIAGLTVTFSAGVAQLPPGGSADDLLRLADEALYRAKEGGRNRLAVGGHQLSHAASA